MSLEKSRIPILGDSSRKFIPEKQRRAMTDPFVERITQTRSEKGRRFQAEWLKPEVKSLQKSEKLC